MSEEPECKEALLVNWDETSVRLHYAPGKGYAASRAVLFDKGDVEVNTSVSRGQMRQCMTHVGLICDDASLQPLLPQIIIGNEHTLKAEELEALHKLVPDNVRIWRRKSA